MEQGLRDCCRSIRIGKILIQRDEDTCKPRLFYDKLPEDIADRWVLLLDPMFATGTTFCDTRYTSTSLIQCAGGSATMAVDILKSKGVPEDRILFLNLIASPEGVSNFAERFPSSRVVTAFVDEGLDEKKYTRDTGLCWINKANMVLVTLFLGLGTSATASTPYSNLKNIGAHESSHNCIGCSRSIRSEGSQGTISSTDR